MVGTNSVGASWIREGVNEASIKAGLLIEVRMEPQWLPAEIVGTAGQGKWKAKLSTDGSTVTVELDEIIKRWPVPVKVAAKQPTTASVAAPAAVPVESSEVVTATSGRAGGALKAKAASGRRSKRKLTVAAAAAVAPKKAARKEPDLFCMCVESFGSVWFRLRWLF